MALFGISEKKPEVKTEFIFDTDSTINQSTLAKDIKINFLDNKDNFSELEWINLYKLSEETFVEETDSLKQGAAGAGLTDNDWGWRFKRKRSEGIK